MVSWDSRELRAWNYSFLEGTACLMFISISCCMTWLSVWSAIVELLKEHAAFRQNFQYIEYDCIHSFHPRTEIELDWMALFCWPFSHLMNTSHLSLYLPLMTFYILVCHLPFYSSKFEQTILFVGYPTNDEMTLRMKKPLGMCVLARIVPWLLRIGWQSAIVTHLYSGCELCDL